MLGSEEVCWQAEATTDGQLKVGLEEKIKKKSNSNFSCREGRVVFLFCFFFHLEYKTKKY